MFTHAYYSVIVKRFLSLAEIDLYNSIISKLFEEPSFFPGRPVKDSSTLFHGRAFKEQDKADTWVIR